MDGDGPPTSARSGCGRPTWTAPMVGRPAAFGGDAEVCVAGGPGLRARAVNAGWLGPGTFVRSPYSARLL